MNDKTGTLYWVYFRQRNIFYPEPQQKMGLRVPEGKTVSQAFYEYWEGGGDGLEIEEIQVAPEWMQHE